MRLSEIVIACFDHDGMLTFYRDLLAIDFEAKEIPQGKIHEGYIDSLKIILCPAELAGITAKENRHQLTFNVSNIKKCMKDIERLGGKFMSELSEADGHLHLAARDVDGNSIVLKQRI